MPRPPRPAFAPVGAGGPFGPGSPLSRLLPRGLDAEELLILAVLLLAMQEGGASRTELLLAAVLYLIL